MLSWPHSASCKFSVLAFTTHAVKDLSRRLGFLPDRGDFAISRTEMELLRKNPAPRTLPGAPGGVFRLYSYHTVARALDINTHNEWFVSYG